MRGSKFREEYLKVVKPSKNKYFLNEKRSTVLQTIKQSYGVSSNKWNNLENLKKINYIFRGDLEERALNYEEIQDIERKLYFDERQKAVQQRAQDIKATLSKKVNDRKNVCINNTYYILLKLEKIVGITPELQKERAGLSLYQSHTNSQRPQPVLLIKDWHYFDTFSKEKENLWNKPDMLRDVNIYCNERPHLDKWAKEQELKRYEKEKEMEQMKLEEQKKRMDEIRALHSRRKEKFDAV
jgi:hypothetical protein